MQLCNPLNLIFEMMNTILTKTDATFVMNKFLITKS